MPRRSSNDTTDPNKAAFRVAKQATQKSALEKNPAAVALGKLGGKKGGKARAEKLTPQRRKEIAANAARARWGTSNDL